jgi:hypothetical protein
MTCFKRIRGASHWIKEYCLLLVKWRECWNHNMKLSHENKSLKERIKAMGEKR